MNDRESLSLLNTPITYDMSHDPLRYYRYLFYLKFKKPIEITFLIIIPLLASYFLITLNLMALFLFSPLFLASLLVYLYKSIYPYAIGFVIWGLTYLFRYLMGIPLIQSKYILWDIFLLISILFIAHRWSIAKKTNMKNRENIPVTHNISLYRHRNSRYRLYLKTMLIMKYIYFILTPALAIYFQLNGNRTFFYIISFIFMTSILIFLSDDINNARVKSQQKSNKQLDELNRKQDLEYWENHLKAQQESNLKERKLDEELGHITNLRPIDRSIDPVKTYNDYNPIQETLSNWNESFAPVEKIFENSLGVKDRGVACGACGAKITDNDKFCMQCGSAT